jgi:hypothetical protein
MTQHFPDVAADEDRRHFLGPQRGTYRKDSRAAILLMAVWRELLILSDAGSICSEKRKANYTDVRA